jgi:hypothetical protein
LRGPFFLWAARSRRDGPFSGMGFYQAFGVVIIVRKTVLRQAR